MKVSITFTITMSEREACSLKKLLGKFSDTQKEEAGLNSADIENMRHLYDQLPFEEQ